jgi:thioester reductase-like protein
MLDDHRTQRVAGDALLITGATGFLGQEILLRYLERTERPIYALIRAENDLQASERMCSILASLFRDPAPYLTRVIAIAADVESADLGLGDARREELASRVTEVIHSAASVSFTLPLAESRRVNVEGTRRMLEFALPAARRCPAALLSRLNRLRRRRSLGRVH